MCTQGLFHRTLRSFARNDNGAIAIMAVFAVPVLVVFLSVVLDTSYNAHVSGKLKHAVDAGSLAGAISINAGLPEDDAMLVANRFFYANFPDGIFNSNITNIDFFLDAPENEVAGTASIERPNLFGMMTQETASFGNRSRAAVGGSSGDFVVNATDIVNALNAGVDVQSVMQGLQISASTANNPINFEVLDNPNGQKFVHNSGRGGGDLIGYLGAGDFTGKIFQNERLRLTTSDLGITSGFSEIRVLMSDVHLRGTWDLSFPVQIFGEDLALIAEVIIYSTGRVDTIVPGIEVTAQPLDDDMNPVPVNVENAPGSMIGYMELTFRAENLTTLSAIDFLGTMSSLDFVEISGSFKNPGGTRLTL